MIRRYFEPALAALMVKDQKLAAKRGEVGSLDFDPFVDAQEWEISEFDIAVSDTAHGKAIATVKFTNLGKPTVVTLDLVAAKNEWRIRDITGQTEVANLARDLRALTAGWPVNRSGKAASAFAKASADNSRCFAAQVGAGEGNRTLVISLEGFCSTIELHPRSRPNLLMQRENTTLATTP